MVALDARKFLHRYPKEMSGGQQQRIGVIRALAADPPVLLMDEPFGAVDPINREVIQNQFLDMQRKLKKTVMLVSHDIDEALKLGDRIAVFRQGRIVQCASPDELLAKPANEFVGSFVGQDRTLKAFATGLRRRCDRPTANHYRAAFHAVKRGVRHYG